MLTRILQELLLKLVEDQYPLPPDPDEEATEANGKVGPGGKAAAGKNKRRKGDVQEAAKANKRGKEVTQQNGTGTTPGLINGGAATSAFLIHIFVDFCGHIEDYWTDLAGEGSWE